MENKEGDRLVNFFEVKTWGEKFNREQRQKKIDAQYFIDVCITRI